MFNIDELYNEKYCAKIDAKAWRFNLIPPTVKVLYNHFNPESVIDVGCANGLHLKAFKDLGVECLFGTEGAIHWASYIEKYFGDQYVILDLRLPFPHIRKFDLVICFEVLEHLEKSHSSQAVNNLCGLGDTLCISACSVSGGFHHFNPQPKEYWIKKFESRDFHYCEDEVDKLQSIFQDTRCSGWFKTGLKVFRKDT